MRILFTALILITAPFQAHAWPWSKSQPEAAPASAPAPEAKPEFWACSCKNLTSDDNQDKECSQGFVWTSKEEASKYAKTKCGANCDPDCMYSQHKSPSDDAMWACSCKNIPFEQQHKHPCSKGFAHTTRADAERFAKKACGESCVPSCLYKEPTMGTYDNPDGGNAIHGD